MNNTEKALKHIGKAIEHLRQTDADDQFLNNLEQLVNSAPDNFGAEFININTTMHMAVGIDDYGNVSVADLYTDGDQATSRRQEIKHNYEKSQVISAQIELPDPDEDEDGDDQQTLEGDS